MRNKANIKHPNRNGFTLVELVLLLGVLGILAIGAFSLRNTQPEEQRFSDTQDRLERIREAVIGNPEAQIEENGLITGFVADIGRLPNSLSELLHQGSLPSWNYHTNSETWAGWRGPYLFTLANINGQRQFLDGWQASGETNNFGWLFQADHTLGILKVQSLGRDSAAGGNSYDLDYPSDQLTVYSGEALINIARWKVTVYLFNPIIPDVSGPALPINTASFRVRLYYPQNGNFDWLASWPGTTLLRDQASYLSLAVEVAAASVADGESLELVFTFGDTPKKVPFGIRSLAVVEDTTGTLVGRSAQAKWRIALLPKAKRTPAKIAWYLE